MFQNYLVLIKFTDQNILGNLTVFCCDLTHYWAAPMANIRYEKKKNVVRGLCRTAEKSFVNLTYTQPRTCQNLTYTEVATWMFYEKSCS